MNVIVYYGVFVRGAGMHVEVTVVLFGVYNMDNRNTTCKYFTNEHLLLVW